MQKSLLYISGATPFLTNPLSFLNHYSDDDSECLPGLVCMERDAWESVPGCNGIGEEGYDYCHEPVDVS